MEKVKLYAREFADEANYKYQTEYSLLISSGEWGKIYGLEIVKTTESRIEKEVVEGFSESREEAEHFLSRLAEGMALPTELTALCDDYISERELNETKISVQAVS